MSTLDVTIPDFGEARDVEVAELLVRVGDVVAAGDALVVLESEKASVEVPSPHAGKVVDIVVATGDAVVEGQVFMRLEGEPGTAEAPAGAPAGQAAAPVAPRQEATVPAAAVVAAAAPAAAPAPSGPAAAAAQSVEVRVPDIGEAKNVVVAELLVAAGAHVSSGDALLVLESDKASMEIEAPQDGTVERIAIEAGSEVSEGTLVVVLRVAGTGSAAAAQAAATAATPAVAATPAAPGPARAAAPAPRDARAATPAAAAATPVAATTSATAPPAAATAAATSATPAPSAAGVHGVHAGPAVRKLARELGVDLAQVTASGQRGRIVKDDVHRHVKARMSTPAAAAQPAAPAGGGIPPIPLPDFARFGPVEEEKLPRAMRVGAQNLHRSWLNLPHVTHHDDADVTELEAFRASLRDEVRERGLRLTPLAFIVKACCVALKEFPRFNASLLADGATLVRKRYYHVGIAVDTPNGLLVPVIRDADTKGIYELSATIVDLSARARDMKLKPEEMQGGTFTITSLGALGGTGFTPIINAPEVAILGVTRLATKPVWDGSAFVPRQVLPLSLSYDHRVINGADAARFTTRLLALLGDVRRLLL
jgi:pyruvate dehydrogenase E2 component (dihydrolipoamide acetyltransferase)